MAELDIGKQCSVDKCKQLDFLPCVCNLCNGVFCKEHASYDAHFCNGFNQLSTPNAFTNSERPAVWYICEFTGCTGREMMEIRCKLCQLNFCLLHRHCDDHHCPSVSSRADPLARTAEHVQNILASQTNPKPKKSFTNSKSVATAAKIALIKLKQKATGDKSVADDDKVFFNIALPVGSKEKNVAMFFSREWCVGKVIDKLASSVGLVNANNRGNTASSLRMFDGVNGAIIPTSRTLVSLLETTSAEQDVVLYNGCTVVIEYVDDTVKQVSVEQYQRL